MKGLKMKNKNILFIKMISLIFMINILGFTQYNNIRIANSPDGTIGTITDNFLRRIEGASYTHVAAGFTWRQSEWTNGEYTGGSGPGSTVALLAEKIRLVNGRTNHNLQFIPILPSANKWSGNDWAKCNNPEIYFEPVYQPDVAAITDSLLSKDSDLYRIYYSKGNPLENIEVADVPIWAHNPNGFAKSYRSVLKDILLPAYTLAGFNYADCRYVHMAYDEPVKYDPYVAKSKKLLIGTSQRDMQWILNNFPNLNAVYRSKVSTVPPVWPGNYGGELYRHYYVEDSIKYQSEYKTYFTSHMRADGNRRLANSGDMNLYYPGPNYNAGVMELIADHISRRVQDVIDFFPDAECLIYANDLFDPQAYAGYFNVQFSLEKLAQKRLTKWNRTIRMNEQLILMPWLYSNTFTHHLEGKVLSADVRWPQTSTVNMDFDARGHYYDFDSTLLFFTKNRFRVMPIYSWDKETPVSHTLSQAYKISNSIAKRTDKERFFPGFGAFVFGKESWNVGSSDDYQQHYRFNLYEFVTGINNIRKSNYSILQFGKQVRIPGTNVYILNQPISCLDYAVGNQVLFQTQLYQKADKERTIVNYFDAILYCNNLSIREGLEPVYKFVIDKKLSKYRTPAFPVVTPDIMDPYADSVIVDYTKNGYRLPTPREIQLADSLRLLTYAPTNSVNYEWVCNGNFKYNQSTGNISYFDFINKRIMSSGSPTAFSFVSFRVVRNQAVLKPYIRECLILDQNQYFVNFRVINPNPDTITIPHGANNNATYLGSAIDSTLLAVTFAPGDQHGSFISYNGSPVSWRLGTNTISIATPLSVSPVLEKVTDGCNSGHNFTAHFGYYNRNSYPVTVSSIGRNYITGDNSAVTWNRTFDFLPGRQVHVFDVDFSSSSIVWSLNNSTATASGSASKGACTE